MSEEWTNSGNRATPNRNVRAAMLAQEEKAFRGHRVVAADPGRDGAVGRDTGHVRFKRVVGHLT